jgi:hypothetical protein
MEIIVDFVLLLVFIIKELFALPLDQFMEVLATTELSHVLDYLVI